MDIRPVDMPEQRVLLARLLRSEWAQEYWRDTVASDQTYRALGPYGAAAHLRRVTIMAAEGALFHVAEDMARLAVAAGATLPLYALREDDLPSRAGVMIFNGAIDELVVRGEERDGAAIAGVMWSEDPDGGGIWLTPLAVDTPLPDGWRRAHHGSLFPGGPRLFPYNDDGITLQREPTTFDRIFNVLRSAWLLMAQPLARDTELLPDRAARRRAARSRYKPKSVRVIELRRPTHSGSGDGSREFHHQWIVRGHWRQQWYPAREVHRPVWIAPHIKGPEGAPLIGGEKVYAWKR